jgi:hypothetical protein
MTDQQLALQPIREGQLLLEEHLRPCPKDNVHVLDELVAAFERPDLIVAAIRLQQRSG